MEKVLDVYEQSYNRDYPVVCFDERPCFLIKQEVPCLEMKSGKVKREDYHFTTSKSKFFP